MQCHCTVFFVNIEQKIKDATYKRCTLYFLNPEKSIFTFIKLILYQNNNLKPNMYETKT